MKKILIYFLLVLNIFSASDKIDELLKKDSENYATNQKSEALVSKNGKVEKLVGQAFLQRDGSKIWVQLVKNAQIEEKTTIITMDNSEIKIKLDKDISVNVGAKTKIYIENLKSKPKTEAITETGLKLMFGKVYSNINKKLETGAKFEIKSGSVVAGVRGTRFLVANLQGGRVEIKVYEGFVVINNTVENKSYTILKNQKVNVDSQGVTEEVKEFDEVDLKENLDESFNEESIDEKIQELKTLVNDAQQVQESNVTQTELDSIKQIINEGVWEFKKDNNPPVVPTEIANPIVTQPASSGNQVIITIN